MDAGERSPNNGEGGREPRPEEGKEKRTKIDERKEEDK
jgi:hypothetical protein